MAGSAVAATVGAAEAVFVALGVDAMRDGTGVARGWIAAD